MKHTEASEQKALFEWAKLQEKVYPELFWLNSSANGQHIANIASRALSSNLGRKRGYPDINLPVSNKDYHGLYIELKVKPNKPTADQIIWLDGLKKNGYDTYVCYGFDEAREVILSYLANKQQHECVLLNKKVGE